MNIYENNKESYNLNYEKRFDMELADWKIQMRDLFLSYSDDRKTLIDLGAGTGRDSEVFKSMGYDVTALDLSDEMVNHLKTLDLKTIRANFIDIDKLDEKYDLIWSMNALLHIPKSDFDKVLQNIKGILKSDGVAFLGLYGGKDSEGIHQGDHYEPKRFFSFHEDDKLKDWMEKHFDVVEFKVVEFEEGNLNFQGFVLKSKS